MRTLHPTAWLALVVGKVEETSGTREDAEKQTWHTDADVLPSALPRNGDLPTHLSMMIIFSDKYRVDMHVGNRFGEYDGVVRRTVVCDGGDLLLFTSTIRHTGRARPSKG